MKPSRPADLHTIRAELHTHSTCSDGQYTVGELVQLLVQNDVQHWALTDHDTCMGCAEAERLSISAGLTFLTGIEVSAYEPDSVHILGYGVDPEHPVMRDFSERRRKRRRSRMREMVERLNQMRVYVTFDEVTAIAGHAMLTRPHLAKALVQRGDVQSIAEAFDRFLGDGKPAYAPTDWPSVEAALGMISEAGGVSVLAHPGVYGRDTWIPSWVEAGLMGIEVEHPEHKPDDVERYIEIADQFGLIKTGSSDFHGHFSHPARQLGQTELSAKWWGELIDAVRNATAAPTS